MAITLLKQLDTTWERAKGPLRLDLDHIQVAINQWKSATFDQNNQILPAAVPISLFETISNTVINNILADSSRFQGPPGQDGEDGVSDGFAPIQGNNFVPYVGATSDVNLGIFGITASQLTTVTSDSARRISTIEFSGTASQTAFRVRESFGGTNVETGLSAWATNAGGTSIGVTRAALGELFWNNVANVAIYANGASIPLIFGTSGVERLRITDAGLVLASPLLAVSGGTGFASFTVGDLLYANTTTTLARLANPAINNVLTSGAGAGTPPVWSDSFNVASISASVAITTTGTGTISSVLSVSANTFLSAVTYITTNSGLYPGGTSRSLLQSPADAQWQLWNNAQSAGVGFDVSTNGTLKLRGTAFTAGTGNLDVGAKLSAYNNVTTVGGGLAAVYGLDNRTGLTTADGAATTLYTALAANNIFRVSADIFATAAVTGTATFTIAWTENGTAQTMVVTSTVINTLGTASNLIRPDNATAITSRLTGVFTGTFTVVGLVEQVA